MNVDVKHIILWMIVGFTALKAFPKEDVKDESWEEVRIGAYSGKPGYYVKMGKTFQIQLDIVVMDKFVEARLKQLTKKSGLGETRICLVQGLKQSTGYSLFKIKSCQ